MRYCAGIERCCGVLVVSSLRRKNLIFVAGNMNDILGWKIDTTKTFHALIYE